MEAVLLTIVFFALAGFGYGIYWFSSHQVGKRRLQSALSTPIADAPNGALVKITGTLVLADEPQLEGPITGRRCVGYVVEVKERRQSGANANWETIVTKEDSVTFVVEDATGRALVKAAGAHLVLVRDGHVRTGTLSDYAEKAKAFLASQGTPSENVLRMKKVLRFEEGVLEPGEEVSVLGIAHWQDAPASTRIEGLASGAKLLVLDAPSGNTLTISDDPATL